TETTAAPWRLPRSPLPLCRPGWSCTRPASRARWRRPSGCNPSRRTRSAGAQKRIHGRAAGRPRGRADVGDALLLHAGPPSSRARRPAGTAAAKSYRMAVFVNYLIQHYDLVQGALEIQYIEEYFGEFPRKKTASEIVRRLEGRAHIILLATAPLPD